MTHHKVFLGRLPRSTSENDLEDAFKKFGHLVAVKVEKNLWTGKCAGFGFVVFDKQTAMEAAIEEMVETKFGGKSITVAKYPAFLDKRQELLHKAVFRVRCFGVGGVGFGENCYKCGKPGHFVEDCGYQVSSSGRYRGRRMDNFQPRYRGDGDSRYQPGGSRCRGSPSTRHRPSPYDRR